MAHAHPTAGRRELGVFLVALLLGGGVSARWHPPGVLRADPPVRVIVPRDASVAALQSFQFLVGDWRGVGQVKRGSNTGAWQETAVARWDHTRHSTGILCTITAGKHWSQARLTMIPADPSSSPAVPSPETASPAPATPPSPSSTSPPLQFLLTVTLLDGSERLYRGTRTNDRLLLETTATDTIPDIHRVTITPLQENRWTLLLETKSAQQSFFQRVGEIGYQRVGTRLATVDGNGPECVVTGGLGTIPVTHDGKTYYVCCTGCRDAFNDDPIGILKAYAERKQAAKK